MSTSIDSHVLTCLLLDKVSATVDRSALNELAETLGVALARLPSTTDDQLLAAPRAMIACALRQFADSYEGRPSLLEEELRVRYYNVLSLEGEAVYRAGATLAP